MTIRRTLCILLTGPLLAACPPGRLEIELLNGSQAEAVLRIRGRPDVHLAPDARTRYPYPSKTENPSIVIGECIHLYRYPQGESPIHVGDGFLLAPDASIRHLGEKPPIGFPLYPIESHCQATVEKASM